MNMVKSGEYEPGYVLKKSKCKDSAASSQNWNQTVEIFNLIHPTTHWWDTVSYLSKEL